MTQIILDRNQEYERNNLQKKMQLTRMALMDVSMGLDTDSLTTETASWILSLMSDDLSLAMESAKKEGVLWSKIEVPV